VVPRADLPALPHKIFTLGKNLVTDKIRTIGVAHFSIPVSNLQRSIEFYTENVGLRLVRLLEKSGMAFMDANGTAVILVVTDRPISTAFVKEMHHAFMVSHDDYAAIVKDLETRGIKLEHEDMRTGCINGPRVYMWDPDGQQIELLDRTSYRGHYL